MAVVAVAEHRPDISVTPDRERRSLYASNSHPRRGGAQRSPGPGRSRRGAGHRPVPPLRRPACSRPPGACPGRSGRHLWASGCALWRGSRLLGSRSQRSGRRDPAPARRARAIERPSRRASEPGAVGGGGTRLIDRSDPSWTGCSPCRPTLAAGGSSFAVSVELALTAPASPRTAAPRG